MSRRRSRPQKPARRRPLWPLVVPCLLGVALGVAWLIDSKFLRKRTPAATDRTASARSVPPPPAPAYEQRPNGTRRARVDSARLAEWCEAVGVPVPAVPEQCEAVVADAILEALHEAAQRPSAAAFGRLGQICESLDAHRSAEQYFQLAAGADPADHRWPYYLGCIAQLTGRFEEAVRHFTHARDLNPQYHVTYARLAQIYLDLNDDEKSAAMSQKFIALSPNDWLGFVGLGRVALRRQDYAAAERYLQDAVQRGPQDFQSHYYLGKAYAALGQQDKAREHFDKSARLPRGEWFHHRDPLDVELHRSIDSTAALLDRMKSLAGSENWPELASLAERILERRPDDVDMLSNLSSFYRKLGRMQDAYRVLERAVQAAPDAAEPHRRLAELYLADSRPRQSLEALDAARQRGPHNATAHSIEARSQFLLKNYAEAEAAIRRALQLAPDTPGNLFVLGEIMRVTGRSNEAGDYYRRVLALRPYDQTAASRLAELGSTATSP